MPEVRLATVLADIMAGPGGWSVGAFIDFDGTMIAGYSGRHVAEQRLRRGDIRAAEVFRTITALASGGIDQKAFTELLQLAARSWKGRSQAEMEEMAEGMFQRSIRDSVYPEMKEIVAAHQRQGHTVVLSTSASSFQVEPLARHLGIEHVLCNRFRVEDGELTGEIEEPVIWGPGKEAAARAFADAHGVDVRSSYFYADGDEDAALMRVVGRPYATNPKKRLAAEAKQEGWPVLRFTSRGSSPGRVIRSMVGMGAGLPLVGLGTLFGIAERDKRAGINFVIERWTDVMLQASNVRVRVVGEDNAWKRRPAVFLVNHRTTFDGVIAMSIVRRDFTTVAKAEINSNPIAAPITTMGGNLLDIAWVPRDDPEAAVTALRPIEELARKGLSVLIAPEGHRAEGDGIGPFKKGAFRIAMAAGLPIVPIVVRNADVIGGRSALAMHAGTVDVAVLEPISVETWTLDDLDERIAEVRQRYIDTLENWPGG